MAYVIPNFNLTCDIYPGNGGWNPVVGALPTSPARLTAVPCALVYGRRVQVVSTGGTSSPGILVFAMNLLVAKGTDIRGMQDSTGIPDWVRCPSGSSRWYQVSWVDDIGKGYPNEHRTASMLSAEGSWTAPYP